MKPMRTTTFVYSCWICCSAVSSPVGDLGGFFVFLLFWVDLDCFWEFRESDRPFHRFTSHWLSIYLSFLLSRHKIVLTSCIVVKYNIPLGGFLCALSSLISTVSDTLFVFCVFSIAQNAGPVVLDLRWYCECRSIGFLIVLTHNWWPSLVSVFGLFNVLATVFVRIFVPGICFVIVLRGWVLELHIQFFWTADNLHWFYVRKLESWLVLCLLLLLCRLYCWFKARIVHQLLQ
jgi:hypothetical protein